MSLQPRESTAYGGVSSPKQTSGFTLVELLVVIAIIGILVALLLPAVQSAREAARRSACQNNLKQMGLSVANYADAQGQFPPGAYSTSSNWKLFTKHFTNWAIEILPYMEQQALYDQYNQELFNTHPDNLPVLRTRIDMMECPSSEVGLALKMDDKLDHTGLIAPGSYKGVSGTRFGSDNGYYDYPGYANDPGRVGEKRGALFLVGVGDFKAVKYAQITDGTSHSLLIGEYSSFEETAEANAIGSALWASSHAYHNLAATQLESYTRIPDFDRCLQVNGNKHWQCDRAFASLHPEVIQFVRCDGSVFALNDDIDGRLFLGMGTIAGDDDLDR